MECHVGFDTNYCFFLLSKFGKTKGTEMLVAPQKKEKKKKPCTQLSIVWLLGLERLDF